MTRRVGLAAIFVAALAACSTGGIAPPEATAATRTIEVRMVDLAFQPSSISVTAGETVRLRFTNDGQLPHDAFIGDLAAQDDHAEEMASVAAHGGGHEAADATSVEPGETRELVHTFDEVGEVRIGCHQPGHYGAGMVSLVTVTA